MKKYFLFLILITIVPTIAKTQTSFVKTQGSKFVLNNEEIIFKGAGQWPTAGWTADTYSKLASIGFNCVRLYINASNATIANPDNIIPGFSTIDNQIAMAKQNGMKVILNVHHSPGSGGEISDRGFFTNPDRQERLAAFWKFVAKRYKNEPTVAGFDIINEPTVKVTPAVSPYRCDGTPYLCYFENYQKIIQKITDVIREVNTTHIIIVERLWIDGGHYSFGIHDQRDCWQNYDGKFNFPDINDPANNYAYTYHCYEPNTWIHQGTGNKVYPSDAIARYNETDPATNQPWIMNKSYLDYAYSVPLNYIREIKNVPAYIGEMGILPSNYTNNNAGINRGGAQYVEDLYDILLGKYKVSNSWHPYNINEFHPDMNPDHEAAFRKAFGTTEN